MKSAKVFVNDVLAGKLIEWEKGVRYEFRYLEEYHGSAVSLTMPLSKKNYVFDQFPPFFDGLLPEGFMLDALLKKAKIDKNDRFEQLMRVGQELVGNVTVVRDDESMPNHI